MHRAIDIVCDPALHSNPAVLAAFEKRVRDEYEARLDTLKAQGRRYRVKSKLVIVGA